MTFDADAAAREAEADYAPFPFTWKGQEYELPHPLCLTTGQSEKLVRAEKEGDEEAMLALFDSLAPDALAAIRDMPSVVTAQLFEQWRAGLGDLGKLDSEPSPPKKAVKRSKPTSKSGGRTSGRSGSTR